LLEARQAFSEVEWLNVLLRFNGHGSQLISNERTKWHLLTSMIAFVREQYNCCELGPRGNR